MKRLEEAFIPMLKKFWPNIAPVEGKRPCMMFVFGGGFVGGQRDNELYTTYFDFLTSNGYDVVSIDYRLGLKKLGNMFD